MNNSRQPLGRLASSDSGTRTRVTPRTQPPAQQLDDEFHAFFDRGDLGDYEGGVAHTQPPASFEPVAYDEHRVIRTSEQRARRAMFTKVVTFVVVGCASLLLIAMSFKSRSQREEARNSAKAYDVQPGVGRAAMIAPAAQQVPGRAESENLQNLTPPPAPPELPELADEPIPDTTNAPEPAKVVAAPVEEKTTFKTTSSAATMAQTKRARTRVASSESLPVARAGHGLVTKVAAKTIPPTPAAKARPSTAAFPVD
jgi:type IV secretory pathway VirB10-like protein